MSRGAESQAVTILKERQGRLFLLFKEMNFSSLEIIIKACKAG